MAAETTRAGYGHAQIQCIEGSLQGVYSALPREQMVMKSLVKGNLTLPMASRSMHLLHIKGLVISSGVCLCNEDALELE
jgi:hypothetical protein